MTTLAEQVQVEVSDRRPGPIRIVEDEGRHGTGSPVVGLQPVVVNSCGKFCLEHARRMEPSHRNGPTVVGAGEHAHGEGIRPVRPDQPIVQAKHVMGIVVTPRHDLLQF
jgi:hypothetical protein